MTSVVRRLLGMAPNARGRLRPEIRCPQGGQLPGNGRIGGPFPGIRLCGRSAGRGPARHSAVGGGAYGPGMALNLGMVTVDTHDARELAQWWADQTGAEVADDYDGWYVMVKGGG